MKHAFWLLALIGCSDDGSARQPLALELDSDLDVVSSNFRQQPPTAVGGTQTFQLHYAGTVPPTPGVLFDQKYTVKVVGDSLRIEEQKDASLTIRGLAPGQSTLQFLYEDGSPIDQIQLSVAAIQKIGLNPDVPESLPRDVYWPEERSVAWYLGDHTLKVGLYQGLDRLGDSSIQIALDGAQRTGADGLVVPGKPVGTYPISVTAGDQPAKTIDYVVVDHADAVTVITDFEPAPTMFQQGTMTTMCFQARNAGRYVVGLTWAITVTGQIEAQPKGAPNCVTVIPQLATGTISVNATAGGQSFATTLTVIGRT